MVQPQYPYQQQYLLPDAVHPIRFVPYHPHQIINHVSYEFAQLISRSVENIHFFIPAIPSAITKNSSGSPSNESSRPNSPPENAKNGNR